MPRNLFLINLIMIIMIGLLGYWFYKVWVRPLDLPVKAGQENVVPDEDADGNMKRPMDKAAYDIIAQKDLFRPSRTASNAESVPASVSAGDAPKLFGTIIKNDIKMAILEDPSSKTTKIYNVNDSVAGFRVSEILQDKVVLMRGNEKIEVKLREEKGITAPRAVRQPVNPRSTRSRNIKRRTSRRTLPRSARQPVSPHVTLPGNPPPVVNPGAMVPPQHPDL